MSALFSTAPPQVREMYDRACARTMRGAHPDVNDSIGIAWYLANKQLEAARSRHGQVNPLSPPVLGDDFKKARALYVRVETAFTAKGNALVQAPTYDELGIKFLTPIKDGIAQTVLPK